MANSNEMLTASNSHVALIGKFTLNVAPYPPPSWSGNELAALVREGKSPIDFGLGYRRTKKTIGKRELDTFEVVCPRDADAETTPLALQNSPLSDALLNAGSDEREVGGQIFGRLLEALDRLAPFWHPDFDRLLSWGLFFFVEDKTYVTADNNKVKPPPSDLKGAIFSPRINQALLAYLRANPTDDAPLNNLRQVLHGLPHASFLEAKAEGYRASLAIEKPPTPAEREHDPLPEEKEHDQLMRCFLETQAQHYRSSLANEQPGAGEIHKTFYNDKSEQMEARNGVTCPKFIGKELPVLFREFRVHAAEIEKISRCEPLTALIIWWGFGKLTTKESADGIAKVAYQKLYEGKGKLWKPRLSSELLYKDQQDYAEGWNEAYTDYLSSLPATAGKKEDSPQAILFQMIMTELIAYRGQTWRPSQSFERVDLIRRLVRTFMSLAAETIQGVKEALQKGKDALDLLNPIYRNFESAYGDTLNKERLKEILKDLPSGLHAWRDQFLSKEIGAGKTLGDAFRAEFHIQVSVFQSKEVQSFLSTKGRELVAELRQTGEAYRRQLEAKSKDGTFAPASSLTGVKPEAKAEEREGLVQEYVRMVARAGGELKVSDSAATELASKLAAKPNLPIKVNRETSQEGPASSSVVFGQEFQPSMLEQKNPSAAAEPGDDALQDLSALVQNFAQDMAKADIDIERIRADILQAIWGDPEAPAKAPARGKLRSAILGEFLLAAPGDLSPLGHKTSSLGSAALLEMVEKVGAFPNYEGKKRGSLLSKKEDLDCGILNVDFHEIWEASKGREGEKQIEEVITYWKDIAKNILNVREYVEDVRSASELIKCLQGKNTRLIYVDETLPTHIAQGRDKLLVWRTSGAEAPPSVIVVSRQATTPETIDADLAGLSKEVIVNPTSVFKHLKLNKSQVGQPASLPLLILPFPPQNGPKEVEIPWIYQPELPPAWIVSFLSGARSYETKIGDSYGRFSKLARGKVANKTVVDELTSRIVCAHWLPQLISAKTLTYALLRLANGQSAVPRETVWEAYQNVLQLLTDHNDCVLLYDKAGEPTEFRTAQELPAGPLQLRVGYRTTDALGQTTLNKEGPPLSHLNSLFGQL